MSNFTFEPPKIKDVFIVTPKVFGDSRGYFMETYSEKDFQAAGLNFAS